MGWRLCIQALRSKAGDDSRRLPGKGWLPRAPGPAAGAGAVCHQSLTYYITRAGRCCPGGRSGPDHHHRGGRLAPALAAAVPGHGHLHCSGAPGVKLWRGAAIRDESRAGRWMVDGVSSWHDAREACCAEQGRSGCGNRGASMQICVVAFCIFLGALAECIGAAPPNLSIMFKAHMTCADMHPTALPPTGHD